MSPAPASDSASDPAARWAAPLRRADAIDRAYRLLTEDDDGRTCEELPAEACHEVPGNFLLNALNGTCTKLAEQLASPGLVLPWMLGAIGAPVSLVGLLVPVNKAGSLLPQLSVAARIRAWSVRKWFWVGAGVGQGIFLAAMIPAVLLLSPVWAGVAVVGLLLLFSLASGVGSVAFKDVVAKTVPEGRRGRLLATRATLGGGLAVAASLWLRVDLANGGGLESYLALVAAAGGLWLLAAAFFSGIRELPGASGGGRNGLQEARAGWRLLRKAPAFRRFVQVRMLLLAAPLVIPFYALHARQVAGDQAADLALFLVASAGASVLASPFWGRFADRDARGVMGAGGLWVAGTAGLALLLGALGAGPWLYALVFLSAGFARAGTRLGRKTYLLDGAPEEERPLMVAVSNTATGVATLAAGALGVVAQGIGVPALVAGLGAMAAAGAALARTLPDPGGLSAEVSEA